MSIFSCIENGSFRSIFRAQLARKNLHKNIRTKKCQKVALQKGEFRWKNQISYGEFLGKWDFKKTSVVCVWDFKVFDFWVFSFWKTCCNLTSYRESQYTKVHLYFTCNKSELAILEFTLLVPLFSNSFKSWFYWWILPNHDCADCLVCQERVEQKKLRFFTRGIFMMNETVSVVFLLILLKQV